MTRIRSSSLWVAVLCYYLTAFMPCQAFYSTPLQLRRPSRGVLRAWDDSYVEDLLQQQGWDRRIISFSESNLPLLVEVQQGGQVQIGSITQLLLEEEGKPPKFQVETLDGSSVKVDLGQLTTIWLDSENVTPQDLASLDPLSMAFVDQTLDQLYQSRVVPGRTNGLTKKQINALISQAPASCQASMDIIFRQLVKTGPNYCRLVDSEIAMDCLWDNNNSKADVFSRRAQAATAMDKSGGGRFKRMPCLLVSSNSESITVINGGWILVDQAVRAASEARQLAKRGGSSISKADDRIVRRLECMAMGEDQDLEVDVREYLKAVHLPVTSNGASQALVQMGVWSVNRNRNRPQAWAPEILQAAEWYKNMDQQRRKILYQAANNGHSVEGRVDLTKLPCVCVDAARATFRDDAIGVRSRASTGRKQSITSKWEILIHIADVSDIYLEKRLLVEDPSNHLPKLREAAANRGTSRYDLPGGPLHLLPPVILQSLALETTNPDLTSSQPLQELKRPSANRCVTLWVYIDETTGKLLDAGVEQTLISCPLALSFESATALLDGNLEKSDPALTKASAILKVAERNLQLWNDYRRERDESANVREKRLAARESIGRQIYGASSSGQDDAGRQGFKRTRGHRLVDSCLDVYGFVLNGLMKRVKTNIPRVAGTERGGRVATAPLRRYIDGMAQRQALAALCQYGGRPMTIAECAETGKRATQAVNAISNIKSSKKSKVSAQQQKAVRALSIQMGNSSDKPVPAMSTGIQSEVVLLGVGAIASCRGIHGTLKPGERVLVKIRKIDEDNGKVLAVVFDPNR